MAESNGSIKQVNYMLRGNTPTTIDSKGRLKIPSAFRNKIFDRYGKEVFITSVTTDGDFVRIYPLEEWGKIEDKLSEISTVNPHKNKFLKVVNYYGSMDEIDKQGRVLIPPILRESAEMNGDVAVLGNLTCFDVWNEDRLLKRMKDDPLTEEDMSALAELGI